MRAVTKTAIKRELSRLGLGSGDIVVVHSSLASFGKVQGGAKTVVDALLETIGPEGTLLAPTQSGDRPYDFRKSPSGLGVITEEIRRRAGKVRSLSPCMPAAAIGPRGKELVGNHHRIECPYIGSPYHLAAEAGGYVLLLGVDQDRNTTLHVAEALEGATYMQPVTSPYVDEKGKVRTYRGVFYAGPHRDFIGIEHKLREAGVLKTTRIGNCVARLMKGRDLIALCRKEIRKDPAFYITPNEGYEDGIDQRGKIKAARIAKEETFTLVARTGSAGANTEEILWHARRAGVSALEADVVDGRDVTRLNDEDLAYFQRRMATQGLAVAVVRPGILDAAGFRGALKACKALGARAVVWPMTGAAERIRAMARDAKKAKLELLLENRGIGSADVNGFLKAVGPGVGLAFNPAHFAAAGELAFLKAFRAVKRHVRYVALTDGSPRGVPCYVGQGNGEVKEVVSVLRCASWDGYLSLGDSSAAMQRLDFDRMTDAFYDALDNS